MDAGPAVGIGRPLKKNKTPTVPAVLNRALKYVPVLPKPQYFLLKLWQIELIGHGLIILKKTAFFNVEIKPQRLKLKPAPRRLFVG